MSFSGLDLKQPMLFLWNAMIFMQYRGMRYCQSTEGTIPPRLRSKLRNEIIQIKCWHWINYYNYWIIFFTKLTNNGKQIKQSSYTRKLNIRMDVTKIWNLRPACIDSARIGNSSTGCTSDKLRFRPAALPTSCDDENVTFPTDLDRRVPSVRWRGAKT